MKTATIHPWVTAAGVGGCLAAMLLTGACAMKESVTDEGDDAGVVVNVQDSSNVVLDFNDTAKTMFSDSGAYNLDDVRLKMSDKGLDPEAINITGIVVTYDDSTKTFITENQGVKFVLKLYLRTEGSTVRKLAMETLPKDTLEFKALAFDPTLLVLALGKHIFSNPAGFPDMLNAIKDKSIHSAWLIAEMTVPGKLKTKGSLKVNMVVTVAGKV